MQAHTHRRRTLGYRRRVVALIAAGALLTVTPPLQASHPGVDPNPCEVTGHRADAESTLQLGDTRVWAHDDGYVAVSPTTSYVEADVSDSPVPKVELSGTGAQIQLRAGHDDQLVCVNVAGETVTVPPEEAQPEFGPVEGVEVVDMPRLHVDGMFWRSEDGRRIIPRGIDYPFGRLFTQPSTYLITDADLERIRSWGMSVLRIRLKAPRAGAYPSVPPEPNYLDMLDDVIARANQHGLYVILTQDMAVLDPLEHPADPGYDQLRFIDATPAHEHWSEYLRTLYARYAGWPGVVGFEPFKEDYSYPPAVHDHTFMRLGHEHALGLLRQHNPPSMYFQEPAGWGYWGSHTGVGHDLGDTNRQFCTLWTAHQQQGAWTPFPDRFERRMQEMVQWARDAGTHLFLCEWVIYDSPNSDRDHLMTLQREALQAMDTFLVGGIRNVYQPGGLNSLTDFDGTETFWLAEYVRPYPMWVSGEVASVAYDFEARRLETELALVAGATTEIFVPQSRTYPDGFVATTDTGRHLVHDGIGVVEASGMSWDPEQQLVLIPSHPSQSRLPDEAAPSALNAGEMVVTVTPFG